MGQSYKVVDADGHVLEPADLWVGAYMEPRFRDQGPRIQVDPDGKERLYAEGRTAGGPYGMGPAGAVDYRREGRELPSYRYAEGIKGGFDPHARIKDLDLDGIDVACLFPTLGLSAGSVEDGALAGAVARAYNRWLADFCGASPDRLVGVAMLPMQSVELAIEEMRFARKELGMTAGFLRPNPYKGRMLHHKEYDPFWAEAQDLDFAIGLHEGGRVTQPQLGYDRFPDNPRVQHMAAHTMEMMLACASVIWCGVCERFPRLRIAFLESGGGWIAPWLDRMDRHFDQWAGWKQPPKLSMRPTEFFRRNCWISFEPGEGNLSVLAEYVGPEKILWATDYPHSDGFFPGAPQMILKRPELSDEVKQQILGGGAQGFYKLS